MKSVRKARVPYPPPSQLDRRMQSHSGNGLSNQLSDYAVWLPFEPDDEAWPWLDAIATVDWHHNPQPLLALMSTAPPPKQVLPYMEDLFNRKFGPKKAGRPKPLYGRADRKTLYELACSRIRARPKGMSVRAAVDREARQWGLDDHSLEAFYKRKSGHSRRKD